MFRKSRKNQDVNFRWAKTLKRKYDEKNREVDRAKKERGQRHPHLSEYLFEGHQRKHRQPAGGNDFQRITLPPNRQPDLFGDLYRAERAKVDAQKRKSRMGQQNQANDGSYFQRLKEDEEQEDVIDVDVSKLKNAQLKRIRQPIVQMPTGSLYQFTFPNKRDTAVSPASHRKSLAPSLHSELLSMSNVFAPPGLKVAHKAPADACFERFLSPPMNNGVHHIHVRQHHEHFNSTEHTLDRATYYRDKRTSAAAGSNLQLTPPLFSPPRPTSPFLLGSPIKRRTKPMSSESSTWGLELDEQAERFEGLPMPSAALGKMYEGTKSGFDNFLKGTLPAVELITVEKKQSRLIALATRNGIPLTRDFVEDMYDKRHRGRAPPKTNPALKHDIDLTDDEDEGPMFY